MVAVRNKTKNGSFFFLSPAVLRMSTLANVSYERQSRGGGRGQHLRFQFTVSDVKHGLEGCGYNPSAAIKGSNFVVTVYAHKCIVSWKAFS